MKLRQISNEWVIIFVRFPDKVIGIIFAQLGEIATNINGWIIIFVKVPDRVGIIFTQSGEIATNIK